MAQPPEEEAARYRKKSDMGKQRKGVFRPVVEKEDGAVVEGRKEVLYVRDQGEVENDSIATWALDLIASRGSDARCFTRSETGKTVDLHMMSGATVEWSPATSETRKRLKYERQGL
jgi:hypothetical protein